MKHMSSQDDKKSEDLGEKIKNELLEKLKSANLTRRQRNQIYRVLRQSEYTKAAGDFMRVVAVWAGTPLGQYIIALIVLEALAKMKFFSQISVDVIIAVLTGSEMIKALGGNMGLVGAVAGLAGLF